MQFTREIHRLLLGLLAALMAVALVATYWVLTGPQRILPRDDNPRNFIFNASIDRGHIIDRDGETLVISVRNPGGTRNRIYLYPEMYSALGYYSLRYGESGAEAAFNALLRGDALEESLQRYFQQEVLHRPQQGMDIRLSFDLTVQRPLAKALDGMTGTAVVLSVPDGGVLALVNSPSYDPNKLDETWNALVNDPGQPFFNRALQGRYQPGNALHTLLMTAAILHDYPLDTRFEDATAPVEAGSTTLSCTLPPPDSTLTLSEAYIYGCPAPFEALIQQLGMGAITMTFNLHRLQNPMNLEEGYAPPVPDVAPEGSLEDLARAALSILGREEALGQGALTLNPLHMTALTAALINGGNAPHPHTLLQTRLPGTDTWVSIPQVAPSMPITTAVTARQLQSLMVQSYQIMSLPEITPPLPENVIMGGRTALAFSGERTLTWFTGFARTDTRRGFAVTVVLENVDDPALAAEIGQRALVAAVLNMDEPPEDDTPPHNNP